MNNRSDSPPVTGDRPNYFRRQVIACGLAIVAVGLSVAGIVKIGGETVDYFTTDKDTKSFFMYSGPSPTEGAKNAIDRILASTNPDDESLKNAVKKIDLSELGIKVSDAIRESTGEVAREQSNYTVQVIVELDGDIVRVNINVFYTDEQTTQPSATGIDTTNYFSK